MLMLSSKAEEANVVYPQNQLILSSRVSCSCLFFGPYGVSQAEAGVEIRGGGQPAKAEVVPAEAPGPGRELLPGQEGEGPAAPGLLPGRRRRAAAAARTRSRCPPEGPKRRHSVTHRS